MALLLVAGIVLGVGGVFGYQEFVSSTTVTTYEECIRAKGSRVQESYPATCITRRGERFTQPTIEDGVNPIYTDPFSCNTDSDCTTGIQTNSCCTCPKPINTSEIGKDNWVLYTPGKNYGSKSKSTCQTLVACAPCDAPTSPVCRDNQCVFNTGTSASPPDTDFTCPETEWIDCMPKSRSLGGKDASIFCSSDYLAWAKTNCPNFKGAAL